MLIFFSNCHQQSTMAPVAFPALKPDAHNAGNAFGRERPRDPLGLSRGMTTATAEADQPTGSGHALDADLRDGFSASPERLNTVVMTCISMI
jgi:hypothetical protein